MTILNPLAWYFLGLVPVLVLLYLVRARTCADVKYNVRNW